MRVQANGSKKQFWLSIDSTTICLYKKVKKEEWNKLNKNAKTKHLLKVIKKRDIDKIQRAVYNKKRLYIWYIKSQNNISRIDLEFQSQPKALTVLEKYDSLRKASVML